MRIAMISFHTNPFAKLGGKQSGGLNVYVRELSRSLAKRGHSIDIFTCSGDGASRVQQLDSAIRLISLAAGPTDTGTVRDYEQEVYRFSQAIIQMASNDELSYGIIHAHYWLSGLVAMQLKNAWGVPSVLMMHTLGLMKERLNLLTQQEAGIRILGERKALAHADKIIAATPAEEAELQWLYEVATSKIAVISPGVDLAVFKPIEQALSRHKLNIAPSERLLLFVGRIDAVKGLETLFAALKLIKDQRYPEKIRLNIIGGEKGPDGEFTNPEINRLIAVAEQMGINDLVHFLGSKKQSELPSYYSAADIVILPSHYESFGLVALEAMACARPVLATRVGGLAHLIEHLVTGLLSAPNAPAEMAEHIVALLNDSQMAQQLGKNALLHAQSKSWDATAKEIEQIYENLRSA